MAHQLFQLPKPTALSSNLTLVAGAKVEFFLTSTTTPTPVYQTSALTTQHTNPVIADAAGRLPPIYLDPSILYRIEFRDSADVEIYPAVDPVNDRILSQAIIGAYFYPRTQAEIDADVTPTVYAYPSGYVRRYGGVGNGVADDTVAVNAAFAQAGEGGEPVCGYEDDVYVCSPLTAVDGDDVVVENLNLKVKADSWSAVGDGSTHLLINGDRPRLIGLTIDGNQAAFASSATGRLLQLDGGCADPVLIDVTLKNSPLVGLRDYSSGGRFTRCHFDDNANLGSECIAASYETYTDCTWNRNGYGFQMTRATNAFSSFGMALRYRTHHITFVGCQSNQCGRDGLNANQGSYAIKYIGCLCWDNDDGGFTVAADNAGSGLPGEAESCHDIEYVDCESYNNYSSGIAAYDPVYNLTATGRVYNNGRALGVLSYASSYGCGVFIGPGSRGINVNIKAYDDRQLRPITAVSGSGSTRVLTATGWTTGSMTAYPRVALYNATNVFQGYGTITAESSGSVTISATANNGVTLGSITSGWQVTQRVQHNGVMFDNSCQGVAKVDGFGFMPGPQEYTGYKVVSGYLDHNQNVLVPDCTLEDTELLDNPSFDVDITGWTISTPGGGSSAQHTSTNRRSPGSLVIVAGSSDGVGDSDLITDGLKYALGAFVEASMWVKADAASDASILLFWTAGGSFFSGVAHPGGGWKKLTVGGFIPPSATGVFIRVSVTATKTAYFDTASLRVRSPHLDNNETDSFSRYLAV